MSFLIESWNLNEHLCFLFLAIILLYTCISKLFLKKRLSSFPGKYFSFFTGPVFGSKDFFSGLAIFFDTYANQNGEHAVSHDIINCKNLHFIWWLLHAYISWCKQNL